MKQKILDATRGGLDVILYYYPQAQEAVDDPKKLIKIRDERTPSTSVRKFQDVWYIRDFGADERGRDCFDVTMEREGIPFKQAIWLLAERYHIDYSYKPNINRAEIIRREPKEGEVEGSTSWVLKEEPSGADLLALGSCVTLEVLQRYNVSAVEYYNVTATKDDKLYTYEIHSNENYPIFLIDFGTFQKIICPYSFEKSHRFRYVGKKPKDVIYGLPQLKKAYAKIQKEDEQEKKLPAVILCSGERDALNCAGMGFPAVWVNSETATFGNKEMKQLLQYAHKVVNVPDLDETGINAAIKRSLENWELYTLFLPDWLRTHHDRRGNCRKDLQDWCDMRGDADEFGQMLETAKRCQFWDMVKLKKDTYQYAIDTINLLWLLRCSGFGQLLDEQGGQTMFVRVHNYTVTPYTPKQVRGFIKSELERRHCSAAVQRAFQDSRKASSSILEDLPIISLNFQKSTEDSRTFFFQNMAIRITSKGIEELPTNKVENYVLAEHIIPHRFTRTTSLIGFDKDGNYAVLPHVRSKYAKVLIQASRMYWKQEYDERETGDRTEDAHYRARYAFSLEGARLTPEEQQEQRLHFFSKCYCLGYLLHQYKTKSNPKALWIMENRLSEDGESSGGSGKSFFVETLEALHLINAMTLSGRDRSLTENKHLLDRLTKWTDVLFIDDAQARFDFDFFYTLITGKTPINPKGEKSYEIDYKDSPIPVFASNFPPPSGKDRSTIRRLEMVVFSDYYHERGTDGLYRETRKISDELGMIAEDDYTEEDFNADYNFIVDCVQFYLTCKQNGKIPEPSLINVYKRINIAEMGASFYDWAEVYFAEDSEHTDQLLLREEVYADYKSFIGNRPCTPQRFMKALRAYCENKSDVIKCLNPPTLYSANCERINRKIRGKTTECIYVQTTDEINDKLPYSPPDLLHS